MTCGLVLVTARKSRRFVLARQVWHQFIHPGGILHLVGLSWSRTKNLDLACIREQAHAPTAFVRGHIFGRFRKNFGFVAFSASCSNTYPFVLGVLSSAAPVPTSSQVSSGNSPPVTRLSSGEAVISAAIISICRSLRGPFHVCGNTSVRTKAGRSQQKFSMDSVALEGENSSVRLGAAIFSTSNPRS